MKKLHLVEYLRRHPITENIHAFDAEGRRQMRDHLSHVDMTEQINENDIQPLKVRHG